MSNRARPRAPGMWPAFRELVLLEGQRFRVAAWRVGSDAGVVLRRECALDAEREITIPLDQWAGFAWSSLRGRWERAA
jgi:hypothetical protein